jgi:hypothetical protein
MFRKGLLAFAAGLLALAPSVASAETRAVIVGVSGYPNLAETFRLSGPKNDAREVATTIVGLGVKPANVTVLADGIGRLPDGIATPEPGTKAAILAALDKLVAETQPGDLAFFYFSGHGSQQPDLNGDEEGGADEIFLPYDIGRWSDSNDGVDNALVDDELSQRVEKILDKGADFFGMIDACHSATGFRDIEGDETHARGVDPAELGVPPTAGVAKRPAVKATGKAAEAKTGRGHAAFFYAAQEYEVALDQTPPGADQDESFGLFTYTMLKRLNQKPDQTYRALHQGVVAEIKKNTLLATQTPELEGDMLDQPVLRLSAAKPLRQWNKNYGDKLEAGQLSGLSAGTVMALYNDAADADDAAVAYGRIDTAGATKSVLVPVAKPCAGGADCSTVVTEESVFKKARFARVYQAATNFALSLSEPLKLDPNDGYDYSGAIAALEAATESRNLSARVSFRSSGYDIAVGLVDGKLVFAPAAGLIDRDGQGSSPRLTLSADPAKAKEEAVSALDRMARALALQRLAADPAQAQKLGLKAGMLVSRYMGEAIPKTECPDDASVYAPPIASGDDPRFGDCDHLSFTMTNNGAKPLDVTILLIGADFSITTVWPEGDLDNRVPIGETKTTEALLQMEPNPAAASEERIVFVAVPGTNKSHTAFNTLDQEGLRGMPGEDGPDVAAARAVLAAALGDMDRAATPTPIGLEEDMTLEVKSFFAGRRGGR